MLFFDLVIIHYCPYQISRLQRRLFHFEWHQQTADFLKRHVSAHTSWFKGRRSSKRPDYLKPEPEPTYKLSARSCCNSPNQIKPKTLRWCGGKNKRVERTYPLPLLTAPSSAAAVELHPTPTACLVEVHIILSRHKKNACPIFQFPVNFLGILNILSVRFIKTKQMKFFLSPILFASCAREGRESFTVNTHTHARAHARPNSPACKCQINRRVWRGLSRPRQMYACINISLILNQPQRPVAKDDENINTHRFETLADKNGSVYRAAGTESSWPPLRFFSWFCLLELWHGCVLNVFYSR